MAFFEYGEREIQYLTEKDKVLGEAIEKIGHVERKVNPDLFGALVSSIVDQQISTKAGQTIWKRMCDGLSEVTPETMPGGGASGVWDFVPEGGVYQECGQEGAGRGVGSGSITYHE